MVTLKQQFITNLNMNTNKERMTYALYSEHRQGSNPNVSKAIKEGTHENTA